MHAQVAELANDVDDPFGVLGSRPDLAAVISISVSRSYWPTVIVTIRSSSASCVLWTPAYSSGLLVKMARKLGWTQVPLVHPSDGHLQQPLLEHRQQDVVGLGPRAVELVIDDGETILAGVGQAMVHPGLGHDSSVFITEWM